MTSEDDQLLSQFDTLNIMNDKDDNEGRGGISVGGNGDDSNANTDASMNDKNDNEGGGWHISRGKGQ